MGEIRCCVCGELIRRDARLKPGEISHGYCPACYRRAIEATEKMIAERQKKKVK